MKTYRSKQLVEALRWTDTDACRDVFATWFEAHGAVFETRGPEVILPEERLLGVFGGGKVTASKGDWVICCGDEFIAMSDMRFHASYEEIA